MIIFLIFFLFVFVLPKFWLSNAMKKNDEELIDMPFTAEEFGQLILKENKLFDVKIEETDQVDHYDLNDKTVRVQQGRLAKKKLNLFNNYLS